MVLLRHGITRATGYYGILGILFKLRATKFFD